MLEFLKRLMAAKPGPQMARNRLNSAQWPDAIYAVGDVHGCLKELLALEALIAADASAFEGETWLVMLGDYVDRGPDSAGVLDRLCARPPEGMRRISLAGNHEVMMLAFLADPHPNSDWLRFGGTETLQSYGIDIDRLLRLPRNGRIAMLSSFVPTEHIEFLQGLPIMLTVPGAVFAHAGIRPGVPLEAQAEEDLLWIREPFLTGPAGIEQRVVHGHTPVAEPVVLADRLGLDTGAFATGRLTAARLTPMGEPVFFSTPSGRLP